MVLAVILSMQSFLRFKLQFDLLLAFLSCFLSFFVKDQRASCQLKEIVAFLKSFVCVFLLLRDCD